MVKKEIPLRNFQYLLHPLNSTLVTTRGKDGKANVLAVAWIMPVSVDPPYLAMSLRPQRYSYKLLMETGEFVVNIPTFQLAKQVVFCGRKSGRDHDKFKETKLKRRKAKNVSPPVIKECVAHLECKLERTIELGDHTLFVGKVISARASEECFDKSYDLKKFQPLLHLRGNIFTTTSRKMVDYTPKE